MALATHSDTGPDLLANAREPEPGCRPEQPSGGADSDIGDDVEREVRLVLAADAVVDGIAYEMPTHDRCSRGDRSKHHHDRDPPVAAGRVAPEARQSCPLRLQRPRLRRGD